jgi:type II secretory pathway component PulJ
MDQDKRRYRQLKRDIKQAGNRKRRRQLQRELEEHPDEAAHTDFDFGRDSSAGLNGNDRDTTRRRHEAAEE